MPPRTVYLILFRGVGGATQLPTAPLRQALTDAGFEAVATYINSGNAVVVSRLDRAKVLARVAALCREQFGFDKAIFVLTLAEWETVVKDNPFPKAREGKHVHAAVLAGVPTAAAVQAIRAQSVAGEAIEVVGRTAYLHTPHGFGTSKMAEKFDKTIGVANTARNWNTVTKLHALAHKAAESV